MLLYLYRYMRKTLRILFAILSILVMGLIFYFSSQNGAESSETSGTVTRLVLSIFVKGFRFMTSSDQQYLIGKYGHLIRKLAHFSEFAALGFSCFGFLVTFESVVKRKGVVLSVLWGILYACSDEFHQMFIASRGPGIIDVLIDTSGVLFGTMLMLILTFCVEHFLKE